MSEEKGWVPWNDGIGRCGSEGERRTINDIIQTVSDRFEGAQPTDDVLEDMRRETNALLVENRAHVEPWRRLRWWRDPMNPTRAIPYV